MRGLPFWALTIGLFCNVVLAVWPSPAIFEYGSEVLWLSPTLQLNLYCGTSPTPYFLIDETGGNSSLSQMFHGSALLTQAIVGSADYHTPNHSEHDVVQKAAVRTLRSLQATNFVPWKFHPRRKTFEPSAAENLEQLFLINVTQATCPGRNAFSAHHFFDGDESYELFISNDTTRINSNSSLGTLRAFQTLQQLFYAHSSGARKYIPNSPISIFDKPVWDHRGLSLDIARNEFSPMDVIRTLDAMATLKMSRLHIHATDSQSWPIEIPALPDLAEKGAYQSSLVWKAADLMQLQLYGIERGILVFIEIDMPGHTASIAHSYPDLVAAFNERDWSMFAAEPQSGQLKLNSSEVYTFLDTLLDDLLPRLSPFSTLFHGGGDEVNRMVYLLDETVRSSDAKDIKPLLQKFMDFLIRKIQEAGLQPILWEEMLLDWNLTLPSPENSDPGKDVIIQVWRDSEHVLKVLEKGYHVLFGDHGHWYLDCGYGGFINPFAGGKSPPGVPFNTSGGESTRIKAPFLDYCNPYKNWRHIYAYDPLENIPEEFHHLIKGGEVLLWSEQTDSINLDAKLWPRAAAAAEVLWSGPKDATMIEAASSRLGQWRERVVIDYGVKSGPVQMTWCLMEGGCDL